MSHYVDETYDAYVEKFRKARKSHACDACRLPIRPGDFYCSVHIVFDGEAETVKRCGACQATHEHLRKLGADRDMWPDERLACGLKYEDEWGDEPPDEVAALPMLSAEERGALLAARARKQAEERARRRSMWRAAGFHKVAMTVKP